MRSLTLNFVKGELLSFVFLVIQLCLEILCSLWYWKMILLC